MLRQLDYLRAYILKEKKVRQIIKITMTIHLAKHIWPFLAKFVSFHDDIIGVIPDNVLCI